MAVENVLTQHIEITPGMVGGKPHIAGSRITVQNIVIWHDRMGIAADEIATEYNVSLADIYAALAYYFDHRPTIDESIRADEEFATALKKRTSSVLAGMA